MMVGWLFSAENVQLTFSHAAVFRNVEDSVDSFTARCTYAETGPKKCVFQHKMCSRKLRVCNRNLLYVQSILRKTFKIVAARCHLLRLKCTKFDFGWGSAHAPAGGAYVAPQTP